MIFADAISFGIVTLVASGLVAYAAIILFSPEARERRRCRRNHRKVVSRARRPIVMLSAKVPRS
jgi:hypothetical protein